MRALVSASDVVGILTAHVDRVHDAARRLGCTPEEAYEVTQTAAGELVGDLADRPETVGDLVGGLFARAREAATRVRRGGGAPVPLDSDATSSLLGDSEEVQATEDALFDLPERRRLGLLLLDSYALTLPQAAVALGLDAAETARTVALGRLAVVSAVDGREAPTLSGHDTAVGDLGMLADGTAPVGGRFAALRRHVSTCATCAGVLGVETRGRGLVAALPVLGLADDDRTRLLGAVGQRAAVVLPTAEQIQAELEGDIERPPLIPWYVTVLAIALALLLGVGVGKLVAGNNSPEISGASVLQSSTSPSSTPTPTRAPVSSKAASTTSSVRTTTTTRSSSLTSTPLTTTSHPPTTSKPPVAARITLNPTSGPNGTTITVTGVGFPSAALVTVTYVEQDGINGDTGSTTTDGSGDFTTTVEATDPAGSSGGLLSTPIPHTGPHTVSASTSTVSRTASFDQTTS